MRALLDVATVVAGVLSLFGVAWRARLRRRRHADALRHIAEIESENRLYDEALQRLKKEE